MSERKTNNSMPTPNMNDSVSANVEKKSSEVAPTTTPTTPTIKLPSDNTLQHAIKLAIVEDKPIMLDYWMPSLDKTVLIGLRGSGERLLVKSEEEYTSAIAKIYKTSGEYILITENSIYIVSNKINTRKIN